MEMALKEIIYNLLLCICPPQKFEATYGSGWDDENALHKFMEDIMSTSDDMEILKSKLSLTETSKIL